MSERRFKYVYPDPDWYELRYEDIKHELSPHMRELHERLRAELERLAVAREPGLTHEEYERRVEAHRLRRIREWKEGAARSD